jgi:poly-gamma-glutamate capsule biosynthesis protein CapA/YwtB (metallophosphatase superfamily)
LKKALAFIFLAVIVGTTLFFYPNLLTRSVTLADTDTQNQEINMHKERLSPTLEKKSISENWLSHPITLAFTGDTLFDWSVRTTIQNQGADYPFQHVKKDIEQADFSIVNLETSVTTLTEKDTVQLYNFKADPTSLEGLKNAGFDLVSLANNHAMDYKLPGLKDTMKHLISYDLPFIGAGNNEKEAYNAHEVFIHGKKIKIIAASRFLPSANWYAGENKPGIANAYQQEKVIEAIQEEKVDTDYLFVFIHWGVEKNNLPEEWQRRFARDMIDAGADGIIGSHPHVLQGFEYYQDKPIAYSLGNFLFPNYVSGKTAQTGVLKLQIVQDEISIQFKPYYIKNDQIIKLSDAGEKDILEYVSGLSFDVVHDGYFFYPEK